MTDYISRQAAITILVTPKELREYQTYNLDDAYEQAWEDFQKRIEQLPSAQPEITDEKAIEHLRSTGWMQNHDREMYDMGLKEQLADDGGSYDSLLPSAQPKIVRCKDCIYFDRYVDGIEKYQWDGFCADWARNTYEDWFCSRADMKGEQDE